MLVIYQIIKPSTHKDLGDNYEAYPIVSLYYPKIGL